MAKKRKSKPDKAVPAMADEKKWETESDMRMMMGMQEIREDPGRMKRVRNEMERQTKMMNKVMSDARMMPAKQKK